MDRGADGSPQANPTTRSVLVVDDLHEIAEFFTILARRMAGHGVRLRTETDPAKALGLLKQDSFDLVVSDFRMPGVDGVEVLKAAHASNPAGRRILMTGYNDIPTPISRIREARIDAYLQKPLRSQDLMLLMLDLLNENESVLATCRQRAREMERLGAREEAPT